MSKADRINDQARLVACPACRASRFKYCVDAHGSTKKCCPARIARTEHLTAATVLRLRTVRVMLGRVHFLDGDDNEAKYNAEMLVSAMANQMLRGRR